MKRVIPLLITILLGLSLLHPLLRVEAGELIVVSEPPLDMGAIAIGSDVVLEFAVDIFNATQSMAIILCNYTPYSLFPVDFRAEMNGTDITYQFDVTITSISPDLDSIRVNCSSISPANGLLELFFIFAVLPLEGNFTVGWRYIYVAYQEPPDPPTTFDERGETLYTSFYGIMMPFYAGWNLIGIPMNPLDPSIEGIFAGNLTKVEYIYGFDNELKKFTYWIRGLPPEYQTLKQLEPIKGYWVYVSANFTQTIFLRPLFPEKPQ